MGDDKLDNILGTSDDDLTTNILLIATRSGLIDSVMTERIVYSLSEGDGYSTKKRERQWIEFIMGMRLVYEHDKGIVLTADGNIEFADIIYGEPSEQTST